MRMASATERLGKVEGRLVSLEKEVKRLGEVVQEERQVALEQQVRMLKDLLEKQVRGWRADCFRTRRKRNGNPRKDWRKP